MLLLLQEGEIWPMAKLESMKERKKSNACSIGSIEQPY